MPLRKPLLSVCLLLLIATPLLAQQAGTTRTITILQLNDVYQISPVDRGRRGGMARVAAMQKSIRQQSPNTLFLLAGDFLSPSVASRLFKGQQMVAALNSAGVDVVTFGNHEFDYGADVLRQRMAESKFAYTIANVLDKKTNRPFGNAQAYVSREYQGVRVAIFGLLLTETATLSSPGPDVRIVDPIAVGKRLSRQLRRKGFDLIIALTHLSMKEDKRLAREADVDLIIGGHEHELLESLAGRAPILKMGSDARNLGRADIHLERRRSSRRRFQIASIDFQAIPVTDAIKDDPQTAAVVADYENRLSESLKEVVGRTSVVLDARAATIRRGESNLGNFIADAYRSALAADLALVNSGGIRSDTTYGPGELSKRDVISLLPFENGIVKVRLTGAHLKRLLENGVSRAGEEDGRFPQISGFSFTYDPGQPAGSRVTSIEIAGSTVDYNKTYTLALSAYTLGGGDGYDLKGAEVLLKPEDGPVEPDIVMEAIRKAGTISPKLESRIKTATK